MFIGFAAEPCQRHAMPCQPFSLCRHADALYYAIFITISSLSLLRHAAAAVTLFSPLAAPLMPLHDVIALRHAMLPPLRLMLTPADADER